MTLQRIFAGTLLLGILACSGGGTSKISSSGNGKPVTPPVPPPTPFEKPTPDQVQDASDALQGHWATACTQAGSNRGQSYAMIFSGTRFLLERTIYVLQNKNCTEKVNAREIAVGEFTFTGYNPKSRLFRLKMKDEMEVLIGQNSLAFGKKVFTLSQRPDVAPYKPEPVLRCPKFHGSWQNTLQAFSVYQDDCGFFAKGTDATSDKFVTDNVWWKTTGTTPTLSTRAHFQDQALIIEKKSTAPGAVDTIEKHFFSTTPCGKSASEKPAYVIEVYDGASTKPSRCTSYAAAQN